MRFPQGMRESANLAERLLLPAGKLRHARAGVVQTLRGDLPPGHASSVALKSDSSRAMAD
jgi:hypothetical protein